MEQCRNGRGNQPDKNNSKPLCDQLTYEDGRYKYPPSIAQRRLTLWNKREERKIAGSAAPIIASINEYLTKNPHMEIYRNQKKSGKGQIHVPLWNKITRKKFTGRVAPLEKNLNKYLADHPNLEKYEGQDKNIPKSELPQRVNIFNEKLDRMVCGNARPYEDTLDEYLKKNPHCRIATPNDYVSKNVGMRIGTKIMELPREISSTPKIGEKKSAEIHIDDIVQGLMAKGEHVQSCAEDGNIRRDNQDKCYSNHLKRHPLPSLFMNTGDAELLFSDVASAREMNELDNTARSILPLQTLERSDTDQFHINEFFNINNDVKDINEAVKEDYNLQHSDMNLILGYDVPLQDTNEEYWVSFP